MSRRNAGGRLLALLGASTTMVFGTISCGPRADDINQVQPGYVRKSIFEQDSEWYYRRTVVKSETTNAFMIEGSGDLPMERVKWRIEEKTLMAYKPYDAVPGTGLGEYEGATDIGGAVLAAFPITSHFDIQRGYDAVTGVETNIIAENASDRPWNEREYFRVDWATDLISGSAADNVYEFPVSLVSTNTQWTDLDTRPTDTYASRFSDDYVEVTHNVFMSMDIYTCLGFLGWSTAAFGECGFGEAKLRHSFARIATPSDYIPRNYPDSIVRKDESGNAITDPVTGEVQREPIFNRFGVFRREIPTYDRGYGATESGKIYRAMIHNIWKRHTDDAGNEIPCNLQRCDREPKPIIYYMNAEFPERWRKAARETAAEYDRVFKGMVTDLVGAARTPEHMFEIRDNDCNIANVKAFVSNNMDLTYAVSRAVCQDGEACDKPLDKVAFGNLMQVCTSLEAATRDPATGKSAFDWQREGDARVSMLVYLNNPQRSGWGGYGPMHSDSLTGETIASTAWIRGHYYELTASNIVDYIELINDEKSIDQIIYGQDIRKHIAAVGKRGEDLAKRNPSQEFTDMLHQRLDRFGGKEDMLKQVDANHQLNRIRRSEGTRIEEAMITNRDLMMASGGMWHPEKGMEISDQLREAASPIGRVTQQNPMSLMRQHSRASLGNAGFCFLDYQFDQHWAGMALALKDLDRAARYQFVAEKILKHVFLHEIGHNMGLSHNFEGTYDALNYDDRFWNTFIGGSDDDKLFERVEEYRHTTVMEYIGQGKAAFGDFLGKYDEAAIRFAYANQVQTFADSRVSPDAGGGEAMRQWRYNNDYQDIADHLCDAGWPASRDGGCDSDDTRRAVIKTRQWVDFDPQNPPSNEVPYLFCDNTYDGLTPFCSTFDYGSNLKEIFDNYHTRWSNYFFFNNFLRDRLSPYGWTITAAMYPAVDALVFVSVAGQYLYYYQAQDPTFVNSPLGKDMQAVVARGLNMAAEVMSTPEPVRMCPWPGLTGDKVYIPYYFLNDCDQFADLSSDYAIAAEAIQLPLGDARPASLGWTADYEDYDFEFVGSYFDKSNVMWLLGLNSPTYLRYNYDIDYRTYSISLFRLFEPEIRTFYDKLINLDPYLIESDTAKDLGSYWCRDAEAPDVAHLGHFESRRMLDDQGTTQVSLPGPSTECEDPATIYPALLNNMPFSAMYWAHAVFSSDFDSELNMGKSLKIYVKGSYDDYPDWDLLDADQICTVTDLLTGLEFRAVRQPEGIPDLGCRLIEKSFDAQSDYLGNPTNPFYKERSRAWFERLEFARDLARVYGDAVILR